MWGEELADFYLGKILSVIITGCFQNTFLAVRAIVIDNDSAIIRARGTEVVGSLRRVLLRDFEVDKVNTIFVLFH